jgi:hypothetical protein
MEKIENYDKIKGWLWLPAIALAMQPISFFAGTILPLLKSHAPNVSITINVPVLIGDIILLGMVGIVAWLYFTRKKIAPMLYIIKIIIMVLMWEIMDGLIESQNDPPFFGMIFHSLVIVPYLLLSVRVKATFVVELDEKIFIERIFTGVSSSLVNIYLKLGRKKALIFVYVVLFLFLTILLNCALRSLRIDGNLLHTFDYL